MVEAEVVEVDEVDLEVGVLAVEMELKMDLNSVIEDLKMVQKLSERVKDFSEMMKIPYLTMKVTTSAPQAVL